MINQNFIILFLIMKTKFKLKRETKISNTMNLAKLFQPDYNRSRIGKLYSV